MDGPALFLSESFQHLLISLSYFQCYSLLIPFIDSKIIIVIHRHIASRQVSSNSLFIRVFDILCNGK